MSHHITSYDGAEHMVRPSLIKASHLFTALHYLLTIVGIAALTVLGAMFINPNFADRVMALSPFSATAEEMQAEQEAQAESLTMSPLSAMMDQHATVLDGMTPPQIHSTREQQLVTNWLAKRYRVAGDATNMLVSAAYITAKEIKLDPLLILAVMAIESSFNPFAESPVGAQGLMQVMSKIHHEKFEDMGGIKAALNPLANIKVGSLILKEYVTRGGSVEAGLKTYVGAANFATDGGYGAKVLAEYNLLKNVAYGKQISHYATAAKPPATVKPIETAVSGNADIAVAEPKANAKVYTVSL